MAMQVDEVNETELDAQQRRGKFEEIHERDTGLFPSPSLLGELSKPFADRQPDQFITNGTHFSRLATTFAPGELIFAFRHMGKTMIRTAAGKQVTAR